MLYVGVDYAWLDVDIFVIRDPTQRLLQLLFRAKVVPLTRKSYQFVLSLQGHREKSKSRTTGQKVVTQQCPARKVCAPSEYRAEARREKLIVLLALLLSALRTAVVALVATRTFLRAVTMTMTIRL